MTQTIFHSVAADVHADRHLLHLVDVHAAAEAAAALRRTALDSADVFLAAAGAVLGGDTEARDRLRDAVTAPEFLELVPGWVRELREVASLWPDTGACTAATALKLWLWTVKHFQCSPHVIDELAEAFCPLFAARCLAVEVATGDSDPLRSDLSQVYAAHASAAAAATCAELVFGYRRHLVWDAVGCASCYAADDLDDLEALIPGFAVGARTTSDIIESDGSHPAKRGPCATCEGVEGFVRLRTRLDACLTGARIAKDRAAAAIARSAE